LAPPDAITAGGCRNPGITGDVQNDF